MNTQLPAATNSAEERAVILIQEIMDVSRETAEHAFMLIEASLAAHNTADVWIGAARP